MEDRRRCSPCGGDDDDDEYSQLPCYHHPTFQLVFSLALLVLFSGVAVLAWTNYVQLEKVHTDIDNVHVQQYTLEGGMRPQFYTHNISGDWSVPSAIVMPADGKMYSRSWCTFSENTRTASVRLVIQATAEVTSNQLKSLVEFRFEVPYGLPVGVLPGTTTEYSKCPAPICGMSDYRIGIGTDHGFQDQESAFFTVGQVVQNRTSLVPTPIECGCSAEVPARMSCSFYGSRLYPQDGPLAIVATITYSTVNVTKPI